MIRLNYFLRRLPSLSLEAFQEYWREKHAVLLTKHASALRVRRYVQAHVLPDDPLGEMMQQIYGTGGEPYDGVAELWWKSPQDLAEALGTSEGQQGAEELLEDERRFVDFSRSSLWFGVDMPQINPPGEIVAREGSTIVKGYYVGRVVPHLSEEQAKFHWLTCHGPLARQYAQFLPYQRYIQVRAVEEPLAEELRAARGGMDVFPTIGNAEVWVDRRELAAVAGPEVDEAFGLLVEDISYFVDVPRSSVFVAKEHIIVDKKITVPPLPKPAGIT